LSSWETTSIWSTPWNSCPRPQVILCEMYACPKTGSVFLTNGSSESNSGLIVGRNEQNRGFRINLFLMGYSPKKYAYWNVEYVFFSWCHSPEWDRASSLLRLCNHTQTHTTLGRTPLDDWSARCRDLYLKTHNSYKRQTSLSSAGFGPKIPANELP
jgi:hypothetical protein